MADPDSYLMSASKPRDTHMPSSLAGIGLVNVATVTWATNMVLARWLRADIGPITLAAVRFAIAAVAFALLLRRQPAEDRRLGSDWRLLVVMSLCGVALFAPLLYLGLRYTTAAKATLINGLGPLNTGLLGALLAQEHPSRRQVGGAIVGLLGIAILISGGSLTSWRDMQGSTGDLIVFGSSILWSLYSIAVRRVTLRRSALSATAFSTFLGLPLLLLAAAWEWQAIPVNPRPGLIPILIYIGLGPTLIGFVAWNEGVRRMGPSGAMVFYNTLPLYGALFGFLLLGESIGMAHLAGGALIIGGSIWAAVGQARSVPGIRPAADGGPSH